MRSAAKHPTNDKSEEMSQNIGTVKAIAHRPVDGDSMIEADVCDVIPGRGIDSENRRSGKREITLISVDAWRDACRELGREVPWWTRRANLLIEGLQLESAIGRRLRIGPVEIQIHGETKPCKLMDAQVQGLTRALVPEFRGGVHGQVLTGGTIRIGDAVELLADG